MIIEFLQWNVVFASFFLYISDFFIQQSVFKTFADILVLDASQKFASYKTT